MNLLPGFGGGSSAPPAPPPPPKDTDPAILEARERLRLSEKQRKGRAATMLAGNLDDLGEPSLARPEARGAKLLGE